MQGWFPVCFKQVFVVVAIVCWQSCTPSVSRFQVIYRGEAIDVSRPDAAWVRSVAIRQSPYQMRVVTSKKKPEWISPSAVWGYRQANGQLFRLYQGAFYRLIRQGELCFYVVDEFGEQAKSSYYFSLTPAGDIWYLNRKNLLMAFEPYPCMHQFIAHTRLSDWLRHQKGGTFGLVQAYRECHLATTTP